MLYQEYEWMVRNELRVEERPGGSESEERGGGRRLAALLVHLQGRLVHRTLHVHLKAHTNSGIGVSMFIKKVALIEVLYLRIWQNN